MNYAYIAKLVMFSYAIICVSYSSPIARKYPVRTSCIAILAAIVPAYWLDADLLARIVPFFCLGAIAAFVTRWIHDKLVNVLTQTKNGNLITANTIVQKPEGVITFRINDYIIKTKGGVKSLNMFQKNQILHLTYGNKLFQISYEPKIKETYRDT